MRAVRSAGSVEPVIRIFVSSTFADMRRERRLLQERVFPDLEEYCRAKGGTFQALV